MKIKLFLFVLLLQASFSFGQTIQINQLSATSVSGGVNINLQVSRVHAASFLSHTYTVNGTTINLSVCYFISPLTMPVNLNNNFLIPVPNNINHTIIIDIMNSTSPTLCNNFSNGPTASINFLDSDSFELLKQDFVLFPNPTNGKLALKNSEKTFNQISFFDIQGRLVKQTKSKQNDFDLFNLENGVYFAKIETENSIITQKIVLKK